MEIITFGWFCRKFKSKEITGTPCKQLVFLNDVIEPILRYKNSERYVQSITSDATANRIFNSTSEIKEAYAPSIINLNIQDDIIRISEAFMKLSEIAVGFDFDFDDLFTELHTVVQGAYYLKKQISNEQYESLVVEDDKYVFFAKLLVYLIKLIPNSPKYADLSIVSEESISNMPGVQEIMNYIQVHFRDYIFMVAGNDISDLRLYDIYTRNLSIDFKRKRYTWNIILPFLNRFTGVYLIDSGHFEKVKKYSDLVVSFAGLWDMPAVFMFNPYGNIVELSFIRDLFLRNDNEIDFKNVEVIKKYFIDNLEGEILFAYGWFARLEDLFKDLNASLNSLMTTIFIIISLPLKRDSLKDTPRDLKLAISQLKEIASQKSVRIVVDSRENSVIREGYVVSMLIDYKPIFKESGDLRIYEELIKQAHAEGTFDKFK
ncbi:hypothetical protein F9856_10130 [Streptococcus suis]|uniref:hypothetical protein n=1 Tax=Streptococcus suis TaxID=1307 RepID=UPI001920C76B|nr:hypothetical protein [Streptococcus suis]MBL1126474.1 hypothetical protein [Streptococcus suis]